MELTVLNTPESELAARSVGSNSLLLEL